MFFRLLVNEELARRVRQVLADESAASTVAAPVSTMPPPAAAAGLAVPTKKKAGRSDALNLAALLQRESRLVDFLLEPINDYSDEQIGAAVRDVHRDAAAVLQRAFAPRPVQQEAEGATIDVPGDFDAARIRFTGKVADRPPFRGTLAHHGWLATQCVLPDWTGDESAALVIAPAVVELA